MNSKYGTEPLQYMYRYWLIKRYRYMYVVHVSFRALIKHFSDSRRKTLYQLIAKATVPRQYMTLY